MHHAIVITINAQFSNNPKFRNEKLTPSSKMKDELGEGGFKVFARC